MIFKGKPVRILMTEDAKTEFEQLNELVVKEISRGITKSGHQILLNFINQKIEFLKRDPEYGVHLNKKKIPKEYIIKYDTGNIWKINLSGAWRMIYTIRGNEVEIISLILDIFDHKRYEKKFKYKKK